MSTIPDRFRETMFETINKYSDRIRMLNSIVQNPMDLDDSMVDEWVQQKNNTVKELSIYLDKVEIQLRSRCTR